MSEVTESRAGVRKVEKWSAEKRIQKSCDFGAYLLTLTSHSPNHKEKRYFTYAYDVSDGPGHGCGVKKWWEEDVVEEFEELQKENADLELGVSIQSYDVNKNLAELQSKFEDLPAMFEELESKYEKLNSFL